MNTMCQLLILPCLLLMGSSLGGTAHAHPALNRMPLASGKDLNGTPWSVPKGLPGERTLVLIGFDEPQQAAIDTWTKGLGLDQVTNTIPWIEMPLIDNPGLFLRWFIDTGMRGGIRDKALRAHVWTAYTDKPSFLRSCGITTESEIRALIVDRYGWILHSESGPYTEKGAERLQKALRNRSPAGKES